MLSREDFFKHYYPVLVLLSKRKSPQFFTDNPDYDGWGEPLSYGIGNRKCLVCGIKLSMVNYPEDPMAIIKHGMQHLKEHNLLPFI